MFERITIVVLDSVGVGHLPDADRFGDVGSDTIGHIHERVGLALPNLVGLGLSEFTALPGRPTAGAFGKMAEQGEGKDTTTGHFEISGLILAESYPTFTQSGFPAEVIDAFCQSIGCDILGNYAASGTDILEELGAAHLETGKPILYTSADSVFQLAAHEDVISLEELYGMCLKARELLQGPTGVARVIARPFRGSGPGSFERTASRKDYALPPPGTTLLDLVARSGRFVTAVGKISDIFSGQGITDSLPAKGNPACIDATVEAMARNDEGLVFTNLVDFDTLYGHRNDPEGYRDCLQAFDARLPELISALGPRDLLVITADHGNDPCYPGTDHTREYVPLLCYREGIGTVDLGLRETFADVAATAVENFGLDGRLAGRSFLSALC